jgi:hypothetical protein
MNIYDFDNSFFIFFFTITMLTLVSNTNFDYTSFQRITFNDIALFGDTFISSTEHQNRYKPLIRSLVALSSPNSFEAMIHPSPIYLFDFVRKKPNSFSIGFSFSISAVNYDYFGEGLSFFITPNVLSQTHPQIWHTRNFFFYQLHLIHIP